MDREKKLQILSELEKRKWEQLECSHWTDDKIEHLTEISAMTNYKQTLLLEDLLETFNRISAQLDEIINPKPREILKSNPKSTKQAKHS